MKELQNKFVYNNETYELPVDDSPKENSSNPVSSKGIYAWVKGLVDFVGKTLTNIISYGNQNAITSGAVYDALQSKANYDTGSLHLNTATRQSVIKKIVDSQVGTTGLVEGTTIFAKSYQTTSTSSANTNKFIYYYKGIVYVEAPQKYNLYYDLETKSFYYWDGSSLISTK